MKWYYIVLIIIIFILLIIFLTAYICYLMTFHVNRKKNNKNKKDLELPPGDIYLPYKEVIINSIKEARKLEHQDITITSFDGLKLYGRYYECLKDAPIEILFHGYRGEGERDLSSGIERCFKLKRNALIVDQRASGKSEGNVITFGINESKDCLSWINYVIETFGQDVKIIITGISMGAATVIMASGYQLPNNVIGVLADCGYDSAKNIIKKYIKNLHLPSSIFYPFVKLGAKIFGKFNLEETSPSEAIKNCKIPIIFFHGDTDDFVPCEMSKNLYEICPSKKRLVIIPEAGHGLCYLVDSATYLKELEEFFK